MNALRGWIGPTSLRAASHPRSSIQPFSSPSFRPAFHHPASRPRDQHCLMTAQGPPVAALKREVEVECFSDELMSLKVDPKVLRQAEDAIAARGGRVTVGDVSAAAGLPLVQSENALRALAADSLATLQVSHNGEIVYVFADGFREVIRVKSQRLLQEPAADKAAAVFYLDRRGLRHPASGQHRPRFVLLVQQLQQTAGRRRPPVVWYWDPFDFRRRAMLRAFAQATGTHPEGMGFLKAIFSFVFGDGDPSVEYERRRWEALGFYLECSGGVVVAEEMAPFLNLTAKQVAEAARPGRVIVDESYIMPALARFGGSPEVGPDGRIFYHFPTLQQTAYGSFLRPPPPLTPEQPWALTQASEKQVAGVVALGLVGIVGVLYLGSLLGNPEIAATLARHHVAWVTGAMPLLQACAAAFFAIPAVRWVLNARRNKAVEARNLGRREAFNALRCPSPELKAKLEAAAKQAKRRVIRERDVVLSSDRPMDEQPTDVEADSWEALLERRAKEQEIRNRSSGSPTPTRKQQQRKQQPEGRQGGLR